MSRSFCYIDMPTPDTCLDLIEGVNCDWSVGKQNKFISKEILLLKKGTAFYKLPGDFYMAA